MVAAVALPLVVAGLFGMVMIGLSALAFRIDRDYVGARVAERSE